MHRMERGRSIIVEIREYEEERESAICARAVVNKGFLMQCVDRS